MGLVQAIVRGPNPYFDGISLYAPGQFVEVEEEFVSDEPTIKKTIKVKLKNPAVVDGKMVRYAEEEVEVATKFAPVGSLPQAVQPTTTAETTAELARLDVTDFLKKSTEEIIVAIGNGTVDDFLGVIEQGELTRKGPARKGITEAVAARKGALGAV